jgi:hypothetical protein
MLELEALGLDGTHTEVSVPYVDHNLLQADSRNAEDHDFLPSPSRRFDLWFSKAGNGVSHPTHMQRFGIPGKTMVGSDSLTPAAGSLGMLAIGVGGTDTKRAGSSRLRCPPLFLGIGTTSPQQLHTCPTWLPTASVTDQHKRSKRADNPAQRPFGPPNRHDPQGNALHALATGKYHRRRRGYQKLNRQTINDETMGRDSDGIYAAPSGGPAPPF